MRDRITDWLLDSDEPWTRYRTLVDLLGRPVGDPDAVAARADMVAHPQVQGLIEGAAAWTTTPLKRHNDASHPIYLLSTLADFGLRADDPGIETTVAAVLARQSAEGPFQTLLQVPERYGGSGEDTWSWMACDSPTVLHTLLALGALNPDDERVQRAAWHLEMLADENGWRCRVADEFGGFRGPGRVADPCPIANVYALRALSLIPAHRESAAVQAGIEALLGHWERQTERKLYLFGIGTDFRKLKYPFVWYDILHVVDVLSQFPRVRDDGRYREMAATIVAQADTEGRYTAGSMYRAWKGWSFADKKRPSPWLTLLALRAAVRAAM